jgi:ComF family protein
VLFVIRALGELLASTLAPNRCAACDDDVPVMTAFCASCARTLTAPEEQDATHFAAFVYGGAIAKAISRLKFEGRPDLARPLSAALRRTARALDGDAPDLVIPVPLHPRRLVERGYNQSAVLAGPVASDLRVRFLPRGLVRERETHAQATLNRAERLTNLDRAFRVRRREDVKGRRVLLVDDVRTTGSTLDACAAVLMEAGALQVRTLVVARTPVDFVTEATDVAK